MTKELKRPSAVPIPWLVFDEDEPERHAVVHVQTWFDARSQGAVRIGGGERITRVAAVSAPRPATL